MIWIIILLVLFVITLVTFCVCGAGGMFLLLALNDFSESQAAPFIVLYVLFSLGLNAAISSALSWMIVKNRYPDSNVKFWMIAGLDIILPILFLGLIFAFIALKNFVFLDNQHFTKRIRSGDFSRLVTVENRRRL